MRRPTRELQDLINELGRLRLCVRLGCTLAIDNDRNMLTLVGIEKGYSRCSHIRITVYADHYAIKMYRMSSTEFKTLYETTNINFEQVQDLITKYAKG